MFHFGWRSRRSWSIRRHSWLVISHRHSSNFCTSKLYHKYRFSLQQLELLLGLCDIERLKLRLQYWVCCARWNLIRFKHCGSLYSHFFIRLIHGLYMGSQLLYWVCTPHPSVCNKWLDTGCYRILVQNGGHGCFHIFSHCGRHNNRIVQQGTPL